MKLVRTIAFSTLTLVVALASFYQFGLDWQSQGAIRNTVLRSEWPYSTLLTEHVVENVAEFDELADRVEEEADDFAVALTSTTDSGLCASRREAFDVCTDYRDSRLLALLTELSISEVSRMEGDGVDVLVDEQYRGDIRLTTWLIRDQQFLAETEACTDRMYLVGTGKCAIKANDRWGILYYWFPTKYR